MLHIALFIKTKTTAKLKRDTLLTGIPSCPGSVFLTATMHTLTIVQ